MLSRIGVIGISYTTFNIFHFKKSHPICQKKSVLGDRTRFGVSDDHGARPILSDRAHRVNLWRVQRGSATGHSHWGKSPVASHDCNAAGKLFFWQIRSSLGFQTGENRRSRSGAGLDPSVAQPGLQVSRRPLRNFFCRLEPRRLFLLPRLDLFQ